VLFASIHADPRSDYPFYAGHADEMGADAGTGFNLNVPLPRGASAAQWFAALETACIKMAGFSPQALVVSLGATGVDGDARAHFDLAGGDFLRIGERIGFLGLPTVFVFEGGAVGPELGINVVNVLEGFETAA
jgi:acetoin utilization deacetylase AcuC-like enzyme